MRLLRAADHRTMPWANGGGVTHEVAVSPDGASMGDFDWRVSVAEVREPGPFSALPGVDRLLLLVSGEVMSLVIDGVAVEASTECAVAFQGESESACVALPGGPTTDLNVMVRRGRFTATLDVMPAGDPVESGDGERVVAVALDSLDAVLLGPGDCIGVASLSAVIRLREGHEEGDRPR